MDVEIYQEDGIESGRSVTLDPTVFEIEPNDHVIWLDVKRVQAHQRQGTAKTKERAEVRGSTRKLYRQKGTGNARVGDAKSPIRRGGGRAHGARLRNYKQNLNKKTKRLARRSAFSYKVQSSSLRVVEDFDIDPPSTKQLTELFDLLDIEAEKVLVITDGVREGILRSASNLSKVEVHEAGSINTVHILNAEVVLVQEGALDHLTEVLSTTETVQA